MDEKISKLFLPLLDKLYNTEPAGEPFRNPVDPVKYGCIDYYLYIKHPIDLSTIRKKLVTNQYKDAWRFVADIQLMFSNAYLFNKRGSPVYEYTNRLNKIWNQELTPIMQRLNYCCGTLHKFGPQLLFCLGTTPDRYCQISVGAKYKCYRDSYSFCMPCFNKIETDDINIEQLMCETSRMKIPKKPVKKSEFVDCTNDHWQYEAFIKCAECTRRIHQICDLYPAEDVEVEECEQHDEIEEQQRSLCKVPPRFKDFATPGTVDAKNLKDYDDSDTNSHPPTSESDDTKLSSEINNQEQSTDPDPDRPNQEATATNKSINHKFPKQSSVGASAPLCSIETTDTVGDESLDDELLQFARNVDLSHSNNPSSPQPEDSIIRFDSAKDTDGHTRDNALNQQKVNSIFDSPLQISKNTINSVVNSHSATLNAKSSVDKIAARLSLNKLNAENHANEAPKESEKQTLNRDKYVCNHCYRKRRLGYNLRHRKYSARRLPHTRMSRYIETKVNEHIRDNSPTAGEVTIRVLTAYRDKVEVKPQMRQYVDRYKSKESKSHANAEEYPDTFEYTNRAIFAWQEIDGVDVCVFGMHVQEYGEDCPEPNRQVVYLSYLDSVHFFRPKQVRTAVYHEILLSYFKYVKKLGFRRVFIWVCPSRKGDDYIFYRHPSEQRMPTLKRLSDWYVHLLDKGVLSGIVERHQTIYDYAMTEKWSSLMSMPYLSGDYWPGEFERLLNIMIESQKKYEERIKEQKVSNDGQFEEVDLDNQNRPYNISELISGNKSSNSNSVQPRSDRSLEQHNNLSLSTLYQRQNVASTSNNGRYLEMKNSLLGSIGLKPTLSAFMQQAFNTDSRETQSSSVNTDDCRFYEPFTPTSSRSDDQPLDLSKSSSNASPESYLDDEFTMDESFPNEVKGRRKRRKSSSTMGYTKKRKNNSSQYTQPRSRATQGTCDGANKYGKSPKTSRQKPGTHQNNSNASEALLHPEEELLRNLERSLKRQKEGFIVVRLSECDCSPHFESQRRKEETLFTCDLMKGREPFLHLARLKKYEFSTLRRAKFSSLAMVKHLGQALKLDPICNECFSFDSSKRHYACFQCKDYYLCTSCHENTHHSHTMTLMSPKDPIEIDEFLQQCSMTSATNSISSASSTISNKSFSERTLELQSNSLASPQKDDSVLSPPAYDSTVSNNQPSTLLLHKNLANRRSASLSMPLGCKKQRNLDLSNTCSRTEDAENAKIHPFSTSTTKLALENHSSPPPSHSSTNSRTVQVELDQVMIENFIRHAELTYSVDFDDMKSESKKLLSHYWSCPFKDTCCRCKFVILSCSFMSVLMRSTRLQMMVTNDGPAPRPSNETNSNSTSGENVTGNGINLTTTHRIG